MKWDFVGTLEECGFPIDIRLIPAKLILRADLHSAIAPWLDPAKPAPAERLRTIGVPDTNPAGLCRGPEGCAFSIYKRVNLRSRTLQTEMKTAGAQERAPDACGVPSRLKTDQRFSAFIPGESFCRSV
jgi:hypothetical protein